MDKINQFCNIDDLLVKIKQVVEDYSGQEIVYLNDIEICIAKASQSWDEYFNLVFNDIDIITRNFDDLEKELELNNFTSKQEWEHSYPSIRINSKDDEDIKSIKIQSSADDKLQVNFIKKFKDDHLSLIIKFIQKKYFEYEHKKNLAESILKKITEKKIDIYEDIDCIYENDFWDIRIYGNIHITNFFYKSRNINYLNFQGFYIAKDIIGFKIYLEDIFKGRAKVELLTTLDSELFFELKVKFEDECYCDFTVIFKNTDLFSIVYKDESCLLTSSALNFIDRLLEDQHIRLGGIKSITSSAEMINIGLINEFGFSASIIEKQLQILLGLFGYNKKLEIMDAKNFKDRESNKVYIFKNIETKDQVKEIQDNLKDKIIFIGCGLEHGLASVSKQKLVSEYCTRIGGERCGFIHQASDYTDLAKHLNPEENPTLKDKQDSINNCYHLADFFITYDSDINSKLSKYKVKQQLKRMLFILHGHPFITPTKDEFMMHMAFSSALKSADLSRQVGAVITNKMGDVLAIGANEVPRSGGGSYWAHVHAENGTVYDDAMGRDYMRGFDSNVAEKDKIIDLIIKKTPSITKDVLDGSGLKDITEYGRVVHAEMDALMACARNNVSTSGTTLYCTTFPCHNCAKHIIAAGIDRVVYLEPYAKSKAFSFHLDSVMDEEENQIAKTLNDKQLEIRKNRPKNTDFSIEPTKPKVLFETFIGVGPKRFKEFFSIKSEGRKDKDGKIIEWVPKLVINNQDNNS